MSDRRDRIAARAEAVSRRFGPTLALDRVDMTVRTGELLGLLGPNGAGKSTLVALLAGLRRPTSGTVEVFGGDPRHPASRRLIGLTPQETGLPATLRVGECVRFAAAHWPDPAPVGPLLERFGLSSVQRRQTGGLSGGQRRRLAVALAFVGRPRLVFLDEPTAGLDVEARRALWEGLAAFHDEGGTVLLTSHYLEEVAALATRVVVLGAGRVLADGDVEEVGGVVGLRRVSMRTPHAPPSTLTGVRRVERLDDRWTLLTADADATVRDLVTGGTPFRDLEVHPVSLEEGFLALTSDASTPAGSSDSIPRPKKVA